MNLILFDEPFEAITLPADDPRATHLRSVLRVRAGDPVFVGFVNGDRARAAATLLEDGSVALAVTGTEPSPLPLPIRLLFGLPRPHTAKRLLFEAASLGISRLDFFEAERGEPSYAQSSLWQTDEWKDRLRLGAEQGFTTHLPEVAMFPDLQTALSASTADGLRIALDNYEAEAPLGGLVAPEIERTELTFGPERGWSPNERDALRRNGWRLAHLGPHVLRSETALVAAVSVVASNAKLWRDPTRTSL